jgi:three-Cys-motif partner protein
LKKSHRDDEVGPWAREKLDALEKYLRFYCNVLKNTGLKLVYIDGFAGAPITTVRRSAEQPDPLHLFQDIEEQQDQFVLGSPIRALNIDPGFDRHYFFDLDPRRVAALDDIRSEWPEKMVYPRVGDANALIQQLVRQIGTRSDVRGVAFLDPYGVSLDWATVAALAATKKFEVIINLPLHMAINRLLANGADRRPEWEARIDRCFGTDEWRQLVYPEKTDLFGVTASPKADGVPEKLLDLYVSRLEKIFKYVASPRLIRNTKKGPLYFLLWAGPHKMGKKGAEYILGSGEKLAKKRRL